MKRAVKILPVFVVCTLLVVGCSSDDSGSATPSPSVASSPAVSASSDPSNSAATDDATASTADGETAADGSASVPIDGDTPPELDAPTVAWFDTFCTGLTPLATLDLSDQVNSGPTDAPDPSDPDNSIQKQTLIEAVGRAGAAFSQTSQALAAQEPPTFDGGAEFATAAASGLGAAGGQISAAVTTFEAVPAGATDEYWAAKTALRTEALAALAPLQSLAEPPAEIQGGVSQIPSCQALGL